MVDPINSFPFETIVEIFSQLSTPDLAISSSISRDWRRRLLTDPEINRVIDLESLDEWMMDHDEIIALIYRLCSNSAASARGPLKEIKLTVNSFWKQLKEFRSSTLGSLELASLMEATNCKFFVLICAISLANKGKLGKISFDVDPEIIGDYKEAIDTAELLIQSAQILLGFPQENLLSEILFRVPFPVDVQARGRLIQFSVEDSSYDCNPSCDSISCARFLQDVVKLTDGGLVKLKLDTDSFQDLGFEFEQEEEDELKELYQEIENSADSLEELNLSFRSSNLPDQVFNLVTSCSKLSVLSLRYHAAGPMFSLGTINANSSFNLKSLTISVWNSHETKGMDWLTSWVGRSLESFSLTLHALPDLSQFKATTLASILRTTSSLKHLALGAMTLIDLTPSTFDQVLPSLQSLHLDRLSLSAYQFVSSLSMPTLEGLNFGVAVSGDPSFGGLVEAEEGAQVGVCFLEILRKCAASLVKLRISTGMRILEPKDENKELMILPMLKELEIFRVPFGLEFFNGFMFSQLKSLFMHRSSIQIQPLFDLLESISTSLEKIRVHQVKIETSEVKPENRLSLVRLQELYLEEASNGLVDLFSHSASSKLTRIDIQGLSSEVLSSSVLSILKSSASSLTNIRIGSGEGLQAKESKPFDTGGNFPSLTHLDLRGDTSLILPPLLSSSFPKISYLCLLSNEVPLYQTSYFIKSISATLKNLTLEKRRFQREEDSVLKVESGSQVFFPKLSYLAVADDPLRLDFLRSLFLGDYEVLSQTTDANQICARIKNEISRTAPKLKDYDFLGDVGKVGH